MEDRPRLDVALRPEADDRFQLELDWLMVQSWSMEFANCKILYVGVRFGMSQSRLIPRR